MTYPSRLVPSSKQKKIEELNPKHFLCRWVDESLELVDSEGKLSTEAIDTHRIFDLSMNKIPNSLKEDILINILDETYKKKWHEGEEGKKVPNDKFEIVNTRNCFFLRIGDIEGFEGCFPFPADKEECDYKFIVKIKHEPLIANYYHCILNFDLFDPDGKEKKLGKKSASKKIIQFSTREILVNNAIIEI